jgi:hypothetical protein
MNDLAVVTLEIGSACFQGSSRFGSQFGCEIVADLNLGKPHLQLLEFLLVFLQLGKGVVVAFSLLVEFGVVIAAFVEELLVLLVRLGLETLTNSLFLLRLLEADCRELRGSLPLLDFAFEVGEDTGTLRCLR